ncbi:MAG: helix-turn-helix transcriptional regulator, partial [Mesorhizobium sp.]
MENGNGRSRHQGIGLRKQAQDPRLFELAELYFPDVPNARRTGLTNKVICGRLGITQESVSLHMRWLTEARLVSATKVRTRVFYKRNEPVK